jgi:hypothetical protein
MKNGSLLSSSASISSSRWVLFSSVVSYHFLFFSILFCFFPTRYASSSLPSPTIPMPVPSSFNDITQNDTLRLYMGWVWYETQFWVPKSWLSPSFSAEPLRRGRGKEEERKSFRFSPLRSFLPSFLLSPLSLTLIYFLSPLLTFPSLPLNISQTIVPVVSSLHYFRNSFLTSFFLSLFFRNLTIFTSNRSSFRKCSLQRHSMDKWS